MKTVFWYFFMPRALALIRPRPTDVKGVDLMSRPITDATAIDLFTRLPMLGKDLVVLRCVTGGVILFFEDIYLRRTDFHRH